MSIKVVVIVSSLTIAAGVSGHASRDVQFMTVQQGPCAKSDANCKPHGWIQVGPGEPGVDTRIVVDPARSGILYTANVGGGVRKSTDNGATWSTVSDGIQAITGAQGFAAYSIAMDASGPDTVYVSVFAPPLPSGTSTWSGVFKTTDGGESWIPLPGLNRIATEITADPYTPGVVYQGSLGGFIEKSTDGGQTWVRTRPLTGRPIENIIIDPANTSTLYAAGVGIGVLKSLDGGLTWATLTGLPSPAIWGVDVDPKNDNILYAATADDGVWRSSDAGATWAATGAIGATPYSFAIDANSNRIFASSTAGVWQSMDDGATWTQTSLTDRMAFRVTLGPDGVLYAGTAFGPEISADYGTTWTDPDPGEGGAQAFGYAITLDPLNTRKAFASTLGATAMISDDRGIDWHPVGVEYAARESRAIKVDPTDSTRVYSGSFYSGVFKSTDSGLTWSKRVFGTGFPYVWTIGVDPVNPNIVYAGTMGEGVWKSKDYGDTWVRLPNYPATVQGITVDPRNDNTVFFASTTGVLRSNDGGATFSTALPRAAWQITIQGGDSPIVYATTKANGVYKSEDNGNTFTAINNGLTSLIMGRSAPVLIDPEHPNVLYTGAESSGALSGAFKSTNGGASWSAVNDGLPDHSVFGMALDADRPGLLYITGPSGIYRTTTGGE